MTIASLPMHTNTPGPKLAPTHAHANARANALAPKAPRCTEPAR